MRLRAVALAGALSAVAVAGCSATPGPYRATAATCYAFSVQALSQHRTITTMPRACAGLSHEQVDLAVARAVRATVGPHAKVAGRRLAHREIAYLAQLIKTATPPGPAPAVAAPAPAGPQKRSLPLTLAALAAWVVTAAAGARLIAGWLLQGGLRRPAPAATSTTGVPRAVVAGHFSLALAGLGVWLAFLVTSAAALAWIAVGIILAVAGLGMATLAGGLPYPAPASGAAGSGTAGALVTEPGGLADAPDRPADLPGGPADEPGGPADEPGGLVRVPAGVGPAPSTATAVLDPRAGPRRPLLLIVLHGALAATAILLVVLAAAGAS